MPMIAQETPLMDTHDGDGDADANNDENDDDAPKTVETWYW